jgi:RNA polymerase sigma-70 factor (ECF subfamily)
MTDWSQIVHEHGPMVWRTIDRLLAHEADTADCFQRTFIAALELSHREPIRHWPAALKRVATHRALEQLRKRIRESGKCVAIADPAAIVSKLDGEHSEPEQAAHSSELAAQLRIALAEIDPQESQAFCLACLDQWSYHEIAAEMAISSNYVGVLLNRARASLRQRLKQFDPAAKEKTSKVSS